MTEEFLHFVWKYGLFDRSGLLTDTGEVVEVIHLGEHNPDAGPDFLNARVRIGNTLWAGNVEIHLRSSDWFAHGHQHDKSYDNVILHVVHKYNQSVSRTGGMVIPTLQLPVGEGLFERYRMLIAKKERISCFDRMGEADPLIVDCWLSALVFERLQQKTEIIRNLLEQYRGDWEEVLYITLARAFGFGINAAPFAMLARSIPLAVLRRHSDSRMQTEALLMGQAGFLSPDVPEGGYPFRLLSEYRHLAAKYSLVPLEAHLWKFLRMRPMNFPTIRIAQFAELMHSSGHFSRILACKEISALHRIFSVGANGFWNVHYTFEKPSEPGSKMLGEEAFQSIVINAVIPVLFLFGSMEGRDDLKDRAMDWLGRLPAESNRIVTDFTRAGIRPSSAFYSQAILQLWKEYCTRKRCLACSVGTTLITNPAR
jgi:hypothetical protein